MPNVANIAAENNKETEKGKEERERGERGKRIRTKGEDWTHHIAVRLFPLTPLPFPLCSLPFAFARLRLNCRGKQNELGTQAGAHSL
jgi:hypothetical protein